VKSAVENLAKNGKEEIETELFVGGRRLFEREQARQRLEVLGFLAGVNAPRTKPTFLFATSAAEVGVDLDADHMVGDLVAWERMVQRLGRVNRRGEGEATVVVVVEQPKAKKKEKEAIDKRDRGEALDEKERKVVEGFEVRSRQVRLYQEPFKRLPKRARFRCELRRSPHTEAGRRARPSAEEGDRRRNHAGPASARADPRSRRCMVADLAREAHGSPRDRSLATWMDRERSSADLRRVACAPAGSLRWGASHQEGNQGVLRGRTAAPKRDLGDGDVPCVRMAEQTRQQPDRSLVERGGRGGIIAFVLARDGQLLRALRLDDLKVDEDKDSEKKRKEMLESKLTGATLVVDVRLAGLKDGLLEDAGNHPPRTADDGQGLAGR
jgi:CRISPR-associated endonuclease/helicase Cas3